MKDSGLIQSEFSLQPPSEQKKASDPSPHGSTDGRVLIVDDEIVNLIMVSKVFRSAGYRVVVAHDGYEALQLLEEDVVFDLIVLDMMMPGLTGADVCVEVRKRFALFQMPILILTAYGDVDAVVDILEKGANDFIAKPFNKQEIIARAKNLVRLKRLTDSNTVLNEALELKDQLINMAVHDIKNPLMGIKQFARLLMSELSEGDSHKKYLKEIESSSSRVLEQVIELLELSKIESGKMPVNKENTLLYSVLLESIIRFRGLASHKKQQLDFTIEGGEKALVYGDRHYLLEIFDNLLSNALKYTPSGKRIFVQLSRFDDGKKNRLRIEVRDEGPGLSKSDMEKLFIKYQKLSAKPTGGESSTGLGLSIAYKLARLHDGDLYARNHSSGASFYFEMDEVGEEEQNDLQAEVESL